MKYICVPRGSWTARHDKEARKVGFRWDGNSMLMETETKPGTPWGCTVRKYKAPAPPRHGFGAAVGIMIGTHDEFGKPL